MNEELQNNIFDSYPELFKNRDDLQQSLMGFGFECSDGWYDLINTLCADIYHYFNTKYEGVGYNDEKYFHEVPKHFSVQQVKEKFGSLRFYISSAPMEIFDMVRTAENKSYRICEECGKNGNGFYRDDMPWIRTLCDKCLDKHVVKMWNRIRKKHEDFISDWQKKHKAPFIETTYNGEKNDKCQNNGCRL